MPYATVLPFSPKNCPISNLHYYPLNSPTFGKLDNNSMIVIIGRNTEAKPPFQVHIKALHWQNLLDICRFFINIPGFIHWYVCILLPACYSDRRGNASGQCPVANK
jgi:hypothetical protein